MCTSFSCNSYLLNVVSVVVSSLPSLTVFDIETTGLNPHGGDRIIEIAGIRIDNGVIDETKAFVSFVNPEREIPWEAKRVNKINDEDVKSAPTIDQVLPQFLDFAAGSILVAHNANFDMGFLSVEKDFCWGYTELPQCVCTMRLSQKMFPAEFSHSLDKVSKRFGLAMPENRHRALPDVLLTAQSLLKLIEGLRIGSTEELCHLGKIIVGSAAVKRGRPRTALAGF